MGEIIIFLLRKGIKILSSGIGKFYPIKIAWDFLFRHLYMLLKKSTDATETEVIKKIVQKDDIVLDIGACMGYYTLIFAKLVGPQGKVFAFEPEIKNFAILRKNVEKSNYQNVTLINKAVSCKTEKTKLYLSDYHLADHRIYDSRDNRKFIEIEAIRLDEYFKNYNSKINFIKMDVQGSEERVIQGMLTLLQRNKKIKCLMEFWPAGLEKSGTNPQKFVNLLRENGFQIYELNDSKEPPKPANIPKLLKIPKGDCTNLLLIKNENTHNNPE